MLRKFIDGLFQTAHALMLTLLFGGALLAGLYLYQNRWDDISRLPVVRELSSNYQQGLQALGGLSGVSLQRYISIDEQAMASPSGQALAADLPRLAKAWNAQDILAKLSFSKAKMRQAQRYTVYIEANASSALRDMLLHKVPASVKLAQALLESNAGESKLATNTNNHFGIKARPSASARQKIRSRQYSSLRNEEFIPVPPAIGAFRFHDDHIYDRFETYREVGDSYARHTQLLTRGCTMGNTGCYAWIWEAYPPGQEHDIRPAARAFRGRSGMDAEDFFGGKTTIPYYAACGAGLKMAGYATSPTYHKQIAYIIETYELWRFDLALLKALEPPYSK